MTETSAMPPDPMPVTETEALVAEVIEEGSPAVGIIMGAASDEGTMAKAGQVLDQAEVSYEVRVMSAHREPDVVAEYCRNARSRGLRVIIAGAGLAAALPGVAAAHTDLPVIGVPLTVPGGVMGGLDALLSVTQMPPGVPVASVGLDAAGNAAHLAVRILGA
jgi:phosphoribosylaminoimidazole carboxylase PurE protein